MTVLRSSRAPLDDALVGATPFLLLVVGDDALATEVYQRLTERLARGIPLFLVADEALLHPREREWLRNGSCWILDASRDLVEARPLVDLLRQGAVDRWLAMAGIPTERRSSRKRAPGMGDGAKRAGSARGGIGGARGAFGGSREGVGAGSGAARARKADEPRPEPVRLGASSPRVVAPGREFTARFVAYAPADEGEVRALLTNIGPRESPQLGQAMCHWKHGTRVEVRVRGDGFAVEDPVRTFTWEGERVLEPFDVRVAADAPAGPSVLRFDVAIEGIVVARLRMHPEIGATPSEDFVHATTEAARRAFASYASADRQRVLDRVAAARISAGLDVFMDCLSLHPGEKWKPELEREITARELFLLFWSAAARESPWVDWEWRLALARKTIDAFQLHPLETVEKAPPPDELRELHFGDIAMIARRDG